MKLVKSLIEPISSRTLRYTPFPLGHDGRGVYTLWEEDKVIEVVYEAGS